MQHSQKLRVVNETVDIPASVKVGISWLMVKDEAEIGVYLSGGMTWRQVIANGAVDEKSFGSVGIS